MSRALLADDDPGVLKALALVDGHAYDLTLSDFRMPGMDGEQLLRRAREFQPGAARMLVSDHANLTAVTGAMNQGAICRSLSKPRNDEDLNGAPQVAFRPWRGRARPQEGQRADFEALRCAPSRFTARHGAPP